MLLYLSVSQHVSTLMGHPQVNTITILKRLLESHRYHNGSVSYYIEGKYVVILLTFYIYIYNKRQIYKQRIRCDNGGFLEDV
jgi:hypothetical protein